MLSLYNANYVYALRVDHLVLDNQLGRERVLSWEEPFFSPFSFPPFACSSFSRIEAPVSFPSSMSIGGVIVQVLFR